MLILSKVILISTRMIILIAVGFLFILALFAAFIAIRKK